MTKKKNFKPKVIGGWDDSFEKFEDRPKKTIGAKDQVKGLVNPSKFVDQVFGPGKSTESKPSKKENPVTGNKEVMVFSNSMSKEDERMYIETRKLINEIRSQIQLLKDSEKAISSEISRIETGQIPEKPGKYYKNFFEWLLSTISQLLQKAEDSQAWLGVFAQKQKKRLNYLQLLKKKGTQYGMSSELAINRSIG